MGKEPVGFLPHLLNGLNLILITNQTFIDMKVLKAVCLLLIAVVTVGCSSHSRECRKMEKDLEARTSWGTTYEWDFETESINTTLQVKEYSKFKDGKYVEVCFFLDGNGLELFKYVDRGKYHVEYDSDLEAYFLVEEPGDKFEIINLHTKEEYFKELELDLRVTMRGDAYDSVVTEEDEDTLYGLEIIECSKERFILEELSSNEVFDYTPYNFDMTTANASLLHSRDR